MIAAPDRPARELLLFLTPVTPAESGNGLAMRAGLFLEGLARSHSVNVLVIPVFGEPGPPGPLVDRYAADLRVLELESDPDLTSELIARVATAAGRERVTALGRRPELCGSATVAAAATVADAAREASSVHVMRLYLAPYLDLLLDGDRPPRLTLDIDDLESEAWEDATGEIERYRRLEEYYLPRFDLVTAAAEEDVRTLRARRLKVRLAQVPNAVRMPTEPTGGKAPHSDLLFVGNLSYAPNVAGAMWLCDEVLPLLSRDVSVSLVGSRPTAQVLRLGELPGVSVAADVRSLTPWYAGASVAVVPLRRGGGSRIKLIEALAHARPVVATALGARGFGISATSDGPVRIADSAPAFARACEHLLAEPDLAARLGAAGRRWVERHVTVERVAARIDSLLRE